MLGQYNINGGTLSGDLTTLFHSFGQFGLLTNETAQFANPINVENIIGRVTGGSASVIDGPLTVNGSANLYLINPYGMLFGNNAQLNLRGTFSASTATGITFGSTLFDVFKTSDVSTMTGNPTGYVFGGTQPGPIINAGDLAVDSGKSLTLLGGQVINTGTIVSVRWRDLGDGSSRRESGPPESEWVFTGFRASDPARYFFPRAFRFHAFNVASFIDRSRRSGCRNGYYSQC